MPSDLQQSIGGKRQIWRSLKTTDYAEAKRRKSAELDQWIATFDDLRRRRTLTESDVEFAVWYHYTTKLDEGDRERANRPTAEEIDAATLQAALDAIQSNAHRQGGIAAINAMTDVEVLAGKASWAARRREARLSRLRRDLATGDSRLIEPEADAALSKLGVSVDRAGEQYRAFCLKLMRADIEQLERYAERDRGDYGGRPSDQIVVPPTSAREPSSETASETIMALFAKYERENPNSIRPETMVQARRDVQHFADFAGPRVRASKIDKRLVREWKDLLSEWPVKATETTIFGDMSVAEIVAANKRLSEPKPTITRNTIRRYMASLGGYCRWLVANDHLQSNPVSDMLPKKNGPANPRSSFTDDAIKILFQSSLFTTCKGEDWRDLDKAGNIAVRDHRFWIPYIMLYSGARPAEIAQLFVGDVRKLHGRWIMHITDIGTAKSEPRPPVPGASFPFIHNFCDLALQTTASVRPSRATSRFFPR